ncbi:unnamed protein product [Dovyalis caffra]|uniref:TIR domain-containing protein n=1 Tax=Dovyalis caffra TaxID=77055 RepID=A0AAV1R275_9ROSI|nr:unnamed protein product [Dovyalis caffra]
MVLSEMIGVLSFLPFASYFSFKRATWSHDVFLSFSGKDARLKLCKRLYFALVTNDIKAYKDDENLEKGKYIDIELLKAIEESRFSIVIFSKNYASSKFCLEELVKMVRSTDVENQTGDYKQAFDDHEKNYSKKMVQSWRDALREVAGIAGWSARNYSEAELVMLVVKQILDKLNPTCPGTSKQLVPLCFNSFFIYQEWDDIQIVWICGIAGMGNTTFARAVYDAVVSEKCKVSSEFPLEWSTRILDPSSEINEIRKKLQHKKVLLIVDEVNKQEHLVDLAIKADLFGPGSRIIVSTTDPDESTQQINLINISFDRQMGRERKICLDVVLFLATSFSLKEMNVHAIRILGSLFNDGLLTKLAFKFLTQSFKVIKDDLLENPLSRRGIVLKARDDDDQSGGDESILEGNEKATKMEKGNINEKPHFKQIDDSTHTATTSIIHESSGRAKQFGSSSSDEKPGSKRVYNTNGAASKGIFVENDTENQIESGNLDVKPPAYQVKDESTSTGNGIKTKHKIAKDEAIQSENGNSDAKTYSQPGIDGLAGNAIMTKQIKQNEEAEAKGSGNLAEKLHSEGTNQISFSIYDRLVRFCCKCFLP